MCSVKNKGHVSVDGFVQFLHHFACFGETSLSSGRLSRRLRTSLCGCPSRTPSRHRSHGEESPASRQRFADLVLQSALVNSVIIQASSYMLLTTPLELLSHRFTRPHRPRCYKSARDRACLNQRMADGCLCLTGHNRTVNLDL